jgi:hypothetical protein
VKNNAHLLALSATHDWLQRKVIQSPFSPTFSFFSKPIFPPLLWNELKGEPDYLAL